MNLSETNIKTPTTIYTFIVLNNDFIKSIEVCTVFTNIIIVPNITIAISTISNYHIDPNIGRGFF